MASPSGVDVPVEGREQVLAAQRRLYATARRLGMARRTGETTAEVAERWVAEGRVPADVAGRFTLLAQAAAFGVEPPDGAGHEANVLADRLVSAFRTSVEPRGRVLAPVRVPVESAAAAGRGVIGRVRRDLDR